MQVNSVPNSSEPDREFLLYLISFVNKISDAAVTAKLLRRSKPSLFRFRTITPDMTPPSTMVCWWL